MKTAIFTFDYELFLGGQPTTSGKINSSLIKPTEKILELFKKYHIKNAIFFVDTIYLHCLSEKATRYKAAKDDLDDIYKQLSNIVTLGHYVFPHIHPHWLDATYLPEINQWDFPDLSRYRFEELNKNDQDFVFDMSMQIIYKLYDKNNIDLFGYRAGGWCIQPFETFIPYFVKHKIVCDFSVLSGAYTNTNAWKYNFINSPEKKIYKFSKDVLKEDTEGDFIEFQISSFKYHNFMNTIIRILTGFYELSRKSNGLKDVYVSPGQQSKSSKASFLKDVFNKLFQNIYRPLSFEGITPINEPYYLRYIKTNNFIQFISHPKLITDNNLKLIEQLICKKKINAYNTDFKLYIDKLRNEI